MFCYFHSKNLWRNHYSQGFSGSGWIDAHKNWNIWGSAVEKKGCGRVQVSVDALTLSRKHWKNHFMVYRLVNTSWLSCSKNKQPRDEERLSLNPHSYNSRINLWWCARAGWIINPNEYSLYLLFFIWTAFIPAVMSSCCIIQSFFQHLLHY